MSKVSEPLMFKSKKEFEDYTGLEITESLLDGRTQKQFLIDVAENQTVDGKPLDTQVYKNAYKTNKLPTQFKKIVVEQKYGSGETTAFIGANYVSRDGIVKNFQATFLLGKEIEVPSTAIPILKQAKTYKQFNEQIKTDDGNQKMVKKVKRVQKFIVTEV